jgi:signal transduction histidine kinase
VSISEEVSWIERYQRLIEISRDLASTLDLEVLLNRIVHAAAELTMAEAASILLYDANKGELYFSAASNLEEPLMRGLIVPVENSIAGWIVTNRQPVVISDTAKEPRHFKSVGKVTQVTTRSILGVPLVAKEKVVGALEAINKRSGEFSPQDQDVLMALGAQAAVAIENSRLFLQSDLISELVHELRTPLTSLSTATELLLRPDLPEALQTKLIWSLQGETARLVDMTSAFLDLARLESGRVQYQPQVFEVCSWLQEIVGLMQAKAQERELNLVCELPPDLPPLKADPDKLKQVLINLISNAIKYNRPGGSVCVVVDVVPPIMTLAVNDTGYGIPANDIPHIFDKFYRAPWHERAAQGTGLGLAICKRIVDAHRGTIEVESQVGVGTTFRVLLPYRGGDKL